MAKKPEKKKPSRNVLVVGETVKKSVGRGKNKTTVTQTKPVRKGLGTRLYCVLEPGSEKRGKKARFTCYGSYEDAAVSMLSRAPTKKGAFSPAALKAMEELEKKKPGGAFSAQALAEMEKSMKGLSGRRRRGLRGTPEEHLARFNQILDEWDSDVSMGVTYTDEERAGVVGRAREEALWLPGRRQGEAYDRLTDRLRAMPARGLRGTPEEHRQRAQSYKRMADFLEMAQETARASGDALAARLLDQTRRQTRAIRSENMGWAEGEVAVGPLAPWENMTSQTANLLFEYGPSEEVENIRQEFQAARRAGLV